MLDLKLKSMISSLSLGLILSSSLAWLMNQAKPSQAQAFILIMSSSLNIICKLVSSSSQAWTFYFCCQAKLEHSLLDKAWLIYNPRLLLALCYPFGFLYFFASLHACLHVHTWVYVLSILQSNGTMNTRSKPTFVLLGHPHFLFDNMFFCLFVCFTCLFAPIWHLWLACLLACFPSISSFACLLVCFLV